MKSASAITRRAATHSGLVAEYRAATPTSMALFERAQRTLPGGETRAVTSYPPHPTVILEAHGARLTDADGRSYLDLVNNYTALVHGNAYQPVIEAVAALLPRGFAFASPHPHQIELAETIAGRIRSVERVRFTNSGTEASLLAVRIAQRATARKKILLFDGAYHGSATNLSPGHPDVVVTPWNDIDRATDVLATGTVAAVLAEPFLGAGGVRPAEPEFLRAIEGAARERGTLFVLDEVQSLRNSLHGLQDALDLEPDLTILGKIIGGGFPIGAVGGREDLLILTVASAAADHVNHAGTFNGHLAAAVAGNVTLNHLDALEIQRLNTAGARLAEQIVNQATVTDLAAEVTRSGSILNVHFTEPDRYASAHLALLLEGVYTTPRGMLNLSTALDQTALDEVAAAYGRAFRRLAG